MTGREKDKAKRSPATASAKPKTVKRETKSFADQVGEDMVGDAAAALRNMREPETTEQEVQGIPLSSLGIGPLDEDEQTTDELEPLPIEFNDEDKTDAMDALQLPSKSKPNKKR